MSVTSFFAQIDGPVPKDASSTWNRSALVRRAVTISRQAGGGAQEIAGKLAARLQAHVPRTGCPWSIFDRKAVEKLQTDPRFPKYLAAWLPAERKAAMAGLLEPVFGANPDPAPLVRQTAEAMLALAEVGNVILIGRGGNVVTARVPHVLHVRLVAPLVQRLRRAHEIYGMTPLEAREFCLSEDLGRDRHVKEQFNAEINDPLRYHLVINTGLVSFDAAATAIEESLMSLGALPKSEETYYFEKQKTAF